MTEYLGFDFQGMRIDYKGDTITNHTKTYLETILSEFPSYDQFPALVQGSDSEHYDSVIKQIAHHISQMTYFLDRHGNPNLTMRTSFHVGYYNTHSSLFTMFEDESEEISHRDTENIAFDLLLGSGYRANPFLEKGSLGVFLDVRNQFSKGVMYK